MGGWVGGWLHYGKYATSVPSIVIPITGKTQTRLTRVAFCATQNTASGDTRTWREKILILTSPPPEIVDVGATTEISPRHFLRDTEYGKRRHTYVERKKNKRQYIPHFVCFAIVFFFWSKYGEVLFLKRVVIFFELSQSLGLSHALSPFQSFHFFSSIQFIG